MKPLSIILLLFTLSYLTKAQNGYIPYVTSDKYWFYDNYDADRPIKNSGYSIWFKGDTTIAAKNYMKVFHSDLKGSHPCPLPPCFSPNVPYEFLGKKLIGYVREDVLLKKVYYLPESESNASCSTSEYIIFDFGLKIGDKIPDCLQSHIVRIMKDKENVGSVVASENVLKYGKLRQTQTLVTPIAYPGLAYLGQIQLIEGIGITYYDPFPYNGYPVFSNFCEGSLSNCNIITSAYEINKIDFQITPNPTPDKVKISSINKIQKIELIDMDGKKIKANQIDGEVDLQHLSQGVYIISITDNFNPHCLLT
jgi:hypothetical protein